MLAVLPVHYRNLSPYIRYAHEIDLNKGYRLLNRVIYDHEFIFGISGQAFVTMNGQTHTARAGDLVLIKPHVPHTMKVVEETPFRCVCVHFDWTDLGPASDFSPFGVYLKARKASAGGGGDAELSTSSASAPSDSADKSPAPVATTTELASRTADELVEFDWPPLMTVTESAPFLAAFREIVKHFGDPGLGAKLHMRASFLRIIALAFQELTTGEGIAKGCPHADLIRDAVRSMRKRYHEPITHSMLTESSGLSPKYFGSLFKGATGRTIAEYLLDIRMEKAKELLLASLAPLKDIAASVGIPDMYYFSKLFKREVGMSPGQYRKTMGK